MTTGEFLELYGERSDTRVELVDGEVRAMSPASSTHAIIQANLCSLIHLHLAAAGSRCYVATEPAISVRVRANANVRIPDLGVSCAPDAPGQVLVPDPILLVEILSPGNSRETWSNVWAYATIPSVSDIVIVHSTEQLVELLRREADGNWPPQTSKIGPGQRLALASIGFECPIGDIYARTHLDTLPTA